MQEDLQKELRFAIIGTVVLDLLIWIVSLFLFHFRIAVLIGLLLGSIGMISNLFLLRRSILNAVYYGKTKDFKGYLLRVLIASAVIAAGLLLESVDAVSCVLPFLYPKLIFGILSVNSRQTNKKF
ncbi:MAG: hypothetical protein IJ642_13325 [Oscillospiraceae bacterium]|nr:hypothetical protein [Oscillospiraceae bacterium]